MTLPSPHRVRKKSGALDSTRCSGGLSVRSPTLDPMTANRDELIHLIEGLPDDQVEVVLADVRRLTTKKPKSTWPPKFVGMLKDGPVTGSSPEYVDAVLSRGFGSERA